MHNFLDIQDYINEYLGEDLDDLLFPEFREPLVPQMLQVTIAENHIHNGQQHHHHDQQLNIPVRQPIILNVPVRQPVIRRNQRNTPNKGYSISKQCFKIMNISTLYNFWNENKNLRKDRLNVILFALIVLNQSNLRLKQFCHHYSTLANQIITGNRLTAPTKFMNYRNAQHFEDIKHYLQISMISLFNFRDNQEISRSLGFLYNRDHPEAINKALIFLNKQQTLISHNCHKKSVNCSGNYQQQTLMNSNKSTNKLQLNISYEKFVQL